MIQSILPPHFANFPQWLHDEEMANPLSGLDELYRNQMEMPIWRQYLYKWLKGIFSHNIVWVGKCPTDMLYYKNQIEKLIEISWLLQQSEPRAKPVKIILQRNVFPMHISARHRSRYKSWDFYPKWLNEEELYQPYQVLDQFFSFSTLAQWKNHLYEWLKQSLSNRNPIEYDDIYEPLLSFEHLNKLIEATYLIYIREWPDNKAVEN